MLFLGRMKRGKLPDHALKAFRVVRKQIPSACLWMVGDGPLRSKYERDKPDNVEFFGRVSEEMKIDLLRRAYLLVIPAVREGWPLAILEANAMGTIAVGYDVPGVRDAVVHERTGLLVPYGNFDMLGEISAKVLADGQTRYNLSENALEWSRKFTWESCADRTLEVMQSAVRNASG
jgi:glycosyltransferase involved in cell wall biosynthesis